MRIAVIVATAVLGLAFAAHAAPLAPAQAGACPACPVVSR